MKISIITVVYNNSSTIEDTINSIINQTYGEIEYIIIDGASTDGTLDIINKYIDAIDIFISEKDHGIYDAMNKGIKLATGEVIGILNSDDIYFNNFVIETIVTAFELEKDLDILYGNLVYVKKHNINHIVRNWISKSYYNKYFDYGNVPPHPSLFIKNIVYKKSGLFNLDFRLAADYEFMLRIFKSNLYKNRYIPSTIVKMRLGGATNNSIKNIVKGNVEILNAWKINGLHAPFTLMFVRFFKRFTQFI